jgi:hypothetical protein
MEVDMLQNIQSWKGYFASFKGVKVNRGLIWGLIILGALLAFELFNYSTTEFALNDVLGSLSFAGLRWSTILALAFCGIDFAGIARLFTPEKGKDEPAEVWYLFGAWLLAASMNAALTWWGVSVAIVQNPNLSSSQVMSNSTLIHVVPVFVAMMVWLIRVLIIGTFSASGDRLFSQGNEKTGFRPTALNKTTTRTPITRPAGTHRGQTFIPAHRPMVKPASFDPGQPRPEPTYHSIAMRTPSNSDRKFVGPTQS